METSTSTAIENSAVTLRAWTHGDHDAQQSISKLIERINKQEESFRDLTEDNVEQTSRQRELAAEVKESTELDETVQDEKSRREAVIKAKTEIVQFATQAWTESSHTLDLISLVVSQFNPKAAEYTMTPFIKQTLPMGCLGAEALEQSTVKGNTSISGNLTSFGWKLQSLSNSADSLLRAATSLEIEMRKEAKYWEDIVAVKQKGWSICTLQRERHTLGVRYGFLESGPEFRDRGLAALRRGEDGSVDLDLGTNFLRPLRVQIKSHGDVLASTSDPLLVPESLEESILQARNNIFDEELYHEMCREARTLTNRGVKCIGDGIVIPLEADVDMIVNLIDEEDSSTLELRPHKLNKYHEMPELAMTAFRLLLSHAHRSRYLQRTALPPPLKKRKQQRSLLAIAQPVLSHLEHRSYLSDLYSHIQALKKILNKAGVSLNLSEEEGNLHVDHLVQTRKPDIANFANDFVRQFCSTLDSSIQMNFGSNGTGLQIRLRTHASGTEFRARKSSNESDSALGRTPDEMSFSDLKEVREYISHIIVIHLVDIAAKQLTRWHITDPDEGELTTDPNPEGEVELLQVRLQERELELTWRSSHITGSPEGTVRWNDNVNTSEKSYLDELERLNAIRGMLPTIL